MLIKRLVISLFCLSLLFCAEQTRAESTLQKCDSSECVSQLKDARRLARKGNEQAQYIVGIALLNGEVFGRNVEAGLHYLRKSSDSGYAAASYQLAYEYRTGRNVPKDTKLYKHYLDVAVKGEYTSALYESAVSFYHAKKNNLAKPLLLKSARKQHTPSLYLLGRILLSEQTEQQDLAELAVLFYHLKLLNYMNSAEVYDYIVQIQPNVDSFVKAYYPSSVIKERSANLSFFSEESTATSAIDKLKNNEKCGDSCLKSNDANWLIFERRLLSPEIRGVISRDANN